MKRIVKGDTRKPVVFRLKSNGVAVNLTGETLEVHYTIGDNPLKNKQLTSSSPLLGEAILPPAADNWDKAGLATGRIYITTGNLKGISWEFSMLVEQDYHAI
jgi:hypothetical protein